MRRRTVLAGSLAAAFAPRSTRAFSRRSAERHPRRAMPNDMQAGVYAGLLHLLKAVAQVGASGDGRAVVAAMKAIPTDQAFRPLSEGGCALVKA